MDRRKLERNIPVIFLFNSLWMMMVLIPVIVPFFNSRGLDMTEIYLLQAVFSVGLLILEVPSGYVSDLLGRRKTLIFAGVFWAIGYSVFPFADDFWTLAIGEVLMAVAVSLASGTDIAVIYDSMNALGTSKAPIKVVGRNIFYQQLGETAAGLLGGWLVLISVNAVAYAQMVLSWLPVIAALFVTEPPRELMNKKKHGENMRYIYRSLFQHSRLLTLILFNSMFYGVASLTAVWAFQKYWQSAGVALMYFGYLWAVSNLTVAVMARYAHKVEKKLGSEFVVILLGVLPIMGFFGMAWVPGWWGLLFCLCFQIARGINSVILKDALNRRVSGDLRATANSVAGLGLRLIFIVLGPLTGHLIDQEGVRYAFTGLGVFYVVVFLLLILPLLAQRKNFIAIRKVQQA